GASTVSSVADEVINLINILIQQKMILADVEKMIFTYPTVASDLEYFY
ncbi:NAD(P)/FAD-dependent oxidoreductase, partial [Lactococcus lactis subsp. lactis]|nr:NAD(P)/FAD-dependent oxidoreductase [Lactococcus lactis subsp. lactis]